MSVDHEVVPDRKGSAATGHIVQGSVVVVANPYRGTKVRSEAYEPSVNIVIGSTGFTCCRTTNAHAATATPDENVFQHIYSSVNGFGIHYAFSDGVLLVKHFALSVSNLQESKGLAQNTIGGKYTIGRSHFQRTYAMAKTTDCHGKVGVSILTFANQSADAHFLSSFYNFVYTNFTS